MKRRKSLSEWFRSYAFSSEQMEGDALIRWVFDNRDGIFEALRKAESCPDLHPWRSTENGARAALAVLKTDIAKLEAKREKVYASEKDLNPE